MQIPQQQEGPPIPIHALPTHLKIGSAVMPTNSGPQAHLTFEFSTPQGISVYFLPASAAERLCEQIRAQASGLILPVMLP